MDERIRARRRAVAHASARRRQRLVGSIVLLLGLLAAAGALATSPLFAIERVEVVGVEGEGAEEVLAVAAVAPGENLLRVDRAEISRTVAGLPWVASAQVRRIPPTTLRIVVTPREPAVVVRILDASWLVDAEGVVVAGGVREDLPIVDAPQSVVPAPGATIRDAAIRNALAVHRDLPEELRAAVDRYEAPSERGLRLRLAGAIAADGGDDGSQTAGGGGTTDLWVRFGAAERVQAKARAITLLLEQARAQAQRQGSADLGIAELDVRAPDNPVLVPAS